MHSLSDEEHIVTDGKQDKSPLPPFTKGGLGGIFDVDSYPRHLTPSIPKSYEPRLVSDAGDIAFPLRIAKEASDKTQRYQWLFGKEPEEAAHGLQSASLLDQFDREVKQARKLYLAGDSEQASLKYRSAIDRFESLLDAVPPGHPLLRELHRRLQLFDELAVKLLGPIEAQPKEEVAGQIFYLMEKRRSCLRNLVLMKAGPLRFFDVPATLVEEEANILKELAETNQEAPSSATRQKEEALKAKLAQVRTSLQKSSPRYALLLKGVPMPLAEVRRDLLHSEEMILDFNIFRDRFIVGVITPERAVYHQVAANRADIDKGVLNLQEKLREFALSGRTTFMGHAWKEPCRRVYRTLLGRLPNLPTSATTVFVIPDRSIWYLPMSVLLDSEDRPFGRDRLITLIPSVEMLRFVRTDPVRQTTGGNTGGLLLFESLPLLSEEDVDAEGSAKAPKKGKTRKLSEGEKIEQLILANPVYPRPSDMAVKIQKMFGKADAWVGPTATIDRLAQYKDRSPDVAVMALPLSVIDAVDKERQPSLFFSPDKRGSRRFRAERFFETPVGSRLMVLPNSWFDVPDSEAPLAEGPLLLSTALLYAATPLALVNYSNPDWGNDDPYLLSVFEKVAKGASILKALGEQKRTMPAGLDSSFSGKPPFWAGWILLGDPGN